MSEAVKDTQAEPLPTASALVVYTDNSVHETDFRYEKLTSFVPLLQQHLKSECTFISVNTVENELPIDKFAKIDQSGLTPSGVKFDFYDTYFVAAFCQDLKALNGSIRKFMKSIAINRSPGKITNVVYLEDLLWVERPYIISQQSKSLLGYVTRSVEGYENFNLKVISSNELLNKWGEGDCSVVRLAGVHEDDYIWDALKNQIDFQQMFMRGSAVPRLISIQSLRNADGNRPLYRHPNDVEPVNVDMQPIVREILDIVEANTGVVGLNHVLIQSYRDGADNIASHSDKTLDINLETPILNVSFGHSRTMYIQKKKNKVQIEKIPLNHGECVVFGLKTNQFWLHEVPKDVAMKEHPVFGKQRISFTFRRIDTYVDEASGCVYGQGSVYKTVDAVRAAVSSRSLPHADSGIVTAASRTNTTTVDAADVTVKTVHGTCADTSVTSAPIEVCSDIDTAVFEFGVDDSVASAPDNTARVSSDGKAATESALRKALIHAFGLENKQAEEFNWSAVYGGGFETK